MSSPAADLRAVVRAGLRGLFVFVLVAAVATLGAQPQPTASSAVTVNVLAAPTVTLTADPATIDAGDEVTLTWTTAEAVSASIDQGVGVLIPLEGGSVTVTPDTTTEYTLTATNRIGGVVTATATVTVGDPPGPPNPDLPVIDSFTASPTMIEAGKSSTLDWETTNATEVTLDGAEVALDGSQSVSPTTSTSYTLRASDDVATTDDDTETVRVTVKPCAIDSFRASPSTISEGGSSTLSWTTTSVSSVSISDVSGTFDDDDSTIVSPTSHHHLRR